MKKSFVVLSMLMLMAFSAKAAEAAIYYVVGNFTDWKPATKYLLVRNSAVTDTDEFMILGVDLKTTYQFKIAKSEDGVNILDADWYPTGMGNNYGEHNEITKDGKYDIYFRPKKDGGEGWFDATNKVLYVVESSSTSIDAVVGAQTQSKKVMRNGTMYILRNGVYYTTTGTEVK